MAGKHEPTNGLRRRIVSSLPLDLKLQDDNGSVQTLSFRLSFDFNAIALIEEQTGFQVLTGEIWRNLNAKNLSIMFWAAILANSPQYQGEDGLEIVRSYMDAGNSDQIAEAILDAYILSLPPEKRQMMKELKEKALHGEGPTKGLAMETPAPSSLVDGSSAGPSPATTSASASPNSES
jgi:hypothetical protein